MTSILRYRIMAVSFSRVVLFALLAWCAVCTAYPVNAATKHLPHGVLKAEGVLKHLQAFEAIALLPENKGSRAVYLGYNASADYIVSQLASTGYKVTVQTLNVNIPEYLQGPLLAVVKPEQVSFRLNTDYLGYNNGGSGDVSANVQIVRGGCSLNDFAGFQKGRIALINRGAFAPAGANVSTCTYREKVTNANNAGAGGILVYNPDDLLPTLGGADAGVTVPVFGISSATANFLIEFGESVVVRLLAQVQAKTYVTRNIIAETPTGYDDRIVVVGSHLDSVPAGAGINDNGSGSATILEMALQFWNLGFSPVNKVRFCWWAAEEWGLLGSYHYVGTLSAAEKARIALNLNFDMIGSPNFIRGLYDGRSGPENVRQGSANIQQLFESYFIREGLTFQTTPFNGRSDYGPFIENGIPAGGLFSGAEEIKTVEQQILFGGSSYAPLDSCYHRACDTVSNISPIALQDLGSAAAAISYELANMVDLPGFLNKQ